MLSMPVSGSRIRRLLRWKVPGDEVGVLVEAGTMSILLAASKQSSSKGSFARFIDALISDIEAIFWRPKHRSYQVYQTQHLYLRSGHKLESFFER